MNVRVMCIVFTSKADLYKKKGYISVQFNSFIIEPLTSVLHSKLIAIVNYRTLSFVVLLQSQCTNKIYNFQSHKTIINNEYKTTRNNQCKIQHETDRERENL